jgi:hypothetical protein
MARKDSEEQMDNPDNSATKRSGQTHSGTPNADNPAKTRSTEHKGGYGGDGGHPRTRPDIEQGED